MNLEPRSRAQYYLKMMFLNCLTQKNYEITCGRVQKMSEGKGFMLGLKKDE